MSICSDARHPWTTHIKSLIDWLDRLWHRDQMCCKEVVNCSSLNMAGWPSVGTAGSFHFWPWHKDCWCYLEEGRTWPYQVATAHLQRRQKEVIWFSLALTRVYVFSKYMTINSMSVSLSAHCALPVCYWTNDERWAGATMYSQPKTCWGTLNVVDIGHKIIWVFFCPSCLIEFG